MCAYVNCLNALILRGLTLLLLVLAVTPAICWAAAQGLLGVYDLDWQLRYYLQEKTLYSTDWQIEYYLRDDLVFDKQWTKRFYLKENSLYDMGWHRRYYVKPIESPEKRTK